MSPILKLFKVSTSFGSLLVEVITELPIPCKKRGALSTFLTFGQTPKNAEGSIFCHFRRMKWPRQHDHWATHSQGDLPSGQKRVKRHMSRQRRHSRDNRRDDFTFRRRRQASQPLSPTDLWRPIRRVLRHSMRVSDGILKDFEGFQVA